MRQKQIYKSNEIVTDLYTWGIEWQTEDGVEYKGLYHTYTTGEVYTESTWDSLISKKLIPYKVPAAPEIMLYTELHDNTLITDYKHPRSALPVVTNKDKTNGYFYRYFIIKNNEPTIIEIDNAQYIQWQTQLIDPNLYTATKLKWIISGLRETIKQTNFDEIQVIETTIPGISDKLIKLDEFYINDPIAIVIPRDINKDITQQGVAGNSAVDTTDTVVTVITEESLQQNKEILDETGKIASDNVTTQILRTAFVDVDIKTYIFITESDFKRVETIRPVTKYIKSDGTIVENPYLNRSGYLFIEDSGIVELQTSDVVYEYNGVFRAVSEFAVIRPIPVLPATKTTTLIVRGIDLKNRQVPASIMITVGKGFIVGPGPTPPGPPTPPPDDPTKTGEGVSQLTAD